MSLDLDQLYLQDKVYQLIKKQGHLNVPVEYTPSFPFLKTTFEFKPLNPAIKFQIVEAF